MSTKLLATIPVLPSADMMRDVTWYQKHLGFEPRFGDKMYAGLRRGEMIIHLQWHAGTADDPLLGGSVVKFFVDDVATLFEEMFERGTVKRDQLRRNTAWKTHEFGVHDPNGNAIFFVEDIVPDAS